MKIKKLETLLYSGVIGAIGTELFVLGQKCYQLYNTQNTIILTIGDIRVPYYIIIEILAITTAPSTFKALKKIYVKNKDKDIATKSLIIKEDPEIESTNNQISNKNIIYLMTIIINYLQFLKERNNKLTNTNSEDNYIEGSFVEIIEDDEKSEDNMNLLKRQNRSKWQEYQIEREFKK